MRKVGLFGGCFNPVTTIHISVCHKALQYLDEIWILPAGHSHYGKKLISGDHRIKMCELAIKSFCVDHPDCIDRIKICDYEIIHADQGLVTSAKIIPRIIEHYNLDAHNTYFVIGADNLEKLSTWDDYEELVARYKLLIIPRKNYDVQPSWLVGLRYILIDCEGADGSSTIVRDVLPNKTPLLFDSVYDYIITHGLFSR